MRYKAADIPNIKDNGTANKAATPVKKSVFFNLGTMSPTTSLDLSPWSPWTLDLPEKELPKSPWKTLPNQSKYLVTGGLSNPNSDLKALTADLVALWPRISVAKSPGKKEKVLKIITEKANTVTKPRLSLNKIVLNIGWILLIFTPLKETSLIFRVISKLDQYAT